MVILLAINDLAYGGGQRTLVAEANQFSRLGHTVYVATLLAKLGQGLEGGLEIPKERLVKINSLGFSDLGSFFRLLFFVRRVKPDIIFSNLFFTNTFTRLVKLFFWKPKIVIREGNVPVEKSLIVWFVDFFLSFLTFRIVVNADIIKTEFSKIFMFEEKIRLVYNGVDKNFFTPSLYTKKDLRDKFGLPFNAFVVVTVASLTRKKGYVYLIEAAYDLLRNHVGGENPRFLFVGDGSDRQELSTIINHLGLDDSILFLGSRQDVKELLLLADVLVLPSLWEGLPNVILEAMAVGVAVIATRVGGVPEIIKDGHNGLLVDPKNSVSLVMAILRLMKNKDLRSQLVFRAREDVTKLTWEDHAKQMLAICAE
jgi:glycosyltransferase involved in cell wall biosynthesis